MTIEVILTKAVTAAASTLGKRLSDMAISSLRGRSRHADLAAARSLSSRELLLNLDSSQLAKMIGSAATQSELMLAIRQPDIEAVISQMLALRVSGSPSTQRAQIREIFNAALRRTLNTTDPALQERITGILFDAIDDACATISNSLEREHVDTVARIRSGAQSAMILATLNNIERHLQTLTSPNSPTWASVREFLDQYQRQARTVHGYLEPPDFDHRRKVAIKRLYVSPTIIDSRRVNSHGNQSTIDDLRGLVDKTVLLGDPGGGKTTASRVLLHHISLTDADNVAFLVTVREFARTEAQDHSVVQFIEARLETYYQLLPPRGAVESLLINGTATVIFDGLDELIDTSRRREVTGIVELFCTRYPLAKVLVTSRAVGYQQAPMNPDIFHVYTLGAFTDDKVREYATKWFKCDPNVPSADVAGLANSFMNESGSIPDLRRNPLLLALICIIYRGQNFIPRNRPEVYERCATMLFEKWDSARKIHVELEAGRVIDSIFFLPHRSSRQQQYRNVSKICPARPISPETSSNQCFLQRVDRSKNSANLP